MKLSLRNFISLITMGVLFQGALELKSFLLENFVENDTPLKEQVNRALNGFPKTPEEDRSKE